MLQHCSILDELLASCDENQHLSTCLPYIAFKKSVGSLAAHEDFELMKYSEFLSMSKNVTEKARTGSEPFSSTFMKPMKKDVDLPIEVLELLVEYYCNAYEYTFATVSNIHTLSEVFIVILLKINQFSRLRVRAKVFGSTHSPKYIKSANVLS